MNSKLTKSNKAKGLMTSTPVAQDNHLEAKGSKKVKAKKENAPTAFGTANPLSKSFEILPAADKAKANSKKPTTLAMVCEAIQEIGEPRKGASYLAVRKWILDHSEDTESKKVSFFVRKAFHRGISTGILDRPAKYKDLTGLRGFFTLPNKNSKKPGVQDAKKKIKVASKKQPAKKETVSDSEMPANSDHPRRLNLSDTAIEDIKRGKSAKVTKVKPGTSAPKIAKGKKKMATAQPSQKTALKAKEATKEKKVKQSSKTLKASSAAKSGETGKAVGAAKTKVRKDLSDTELEVKPKVRKSLKSYASDTEVDIVKENAAKKKAKQPSKTYAAIGETASKRNRKATADGPERSLKVTEGSKISKSHKAKKGT